MSEELDEPLELGDPDQIRENVFVVNLRVKALEAERDRLKSKLENWKLAQGVSSMPYVQEIDRLKSDLENEKIEVMSYARNLNKCVAERNGAREDRDLWKAKAEKLAEALRRMCDQKPTENVTFSTLIFKGSDCIWAWRGLKAALVEFGEAI